MNPRLLSDVAIAVEGELVGDDVEVSSVVTDSRRASAGSLFVALPGEHRDGAAFTPDAFARGAAGALVGLHVDAEGPIIRVEATLEALMRLAEDERRRALADVTVVAVTGANGKTSTKDLAASVLSQRFRTHASPASFNNEIGLPATMLSAPAGVQVIVAEMGARHVGDARALCRIARPDVVIVTNIGLAHLEIFGSWEAIVAAGSEPVEALGAGDVAILNAEDPVVASYADRTSARVVSFGRIEAAEVRARGVELDQEGDASFTLVHGDASERVELAVAGEHMVSNALAAAACGIVLGLAPMECSAGLKEARISPWRMETFTSAAGLRVVNDAYNANPESTAAALKASRWMAGHARLIAVLGTMAELGPVAEREHDRIGALAARIRVDRLVTVGDAARTIAAAALREGMEPENVATCRTVEDALGDVRTHARDGDVVLCKGSRIVGLERLAEALR
jgi:UDP-N-acetylmuramoyl-tripeptide--D-alanyl-D-alanine ligase